MVVVAGRTGEQDWERRVDDDVVEEAAAVSGRALGVAGADILRTSGGE